MPTQNTARYHNVRRTKESGIPPNIGNPHLTARCKIDGPEAKQTGGEDLEHFVRRFCPTEVHLCVPMHKSSLLKPLTFTFMHRYICVWLDMYSVSSWLGLCRHGEVQCDWTEAEKSNRGARHHAVCDGVKGVGKGSTVDVPAMTTSI